ncbi:MAG TPA: hypothetical protein VH257_16010, partial [Chloroflexota bacterium]|nr:hypothetical protein [Chloroflexota bacterium]
ARSGFQAATIRLNAAKGIYSGPQGSVIGGPAGGMSAPAWTEPSTSLILSVLTTGTSNLLEEIRQMLADTAASGQSQAPYRRSRQVPTFQQPGGPPGPNQDPARLDLGVAGLALVAAATDTWTAVALGFGTTAFPNEVFIPVPPKLAPNGAPFGAPAGLAAVTGGPAPQPVPLVDMEYMVAVNVRRSNGQVMELAAVASTVRTPVLGPALGQLQASTLRRHRPLNRDQPRTEDVEVRWPRLAGSLRPHQYALGFQPGNTTSVVVLNESRPGGGFIPYVPARRPDGDVDNEQVVAFVDNARPVPLTGSRTDTYVCAALDVFGRWSPWVAAPHLMQPDPPPLPPQIMRATFTTQNKKNVPGRIVFATLEIELAWDWEDRSPAQWELVGQFFNPATAPPAEAPAKFGAPDSSLNTDPIKVTLFSPDSVSTSRATIVPLPDKSTDGEVRRYKLTRTFVELDFGPSPDLAFAVYVRSNHKVEPGRFSPYSAPAVARVKDPLPADPPTVQPEIKWTALPDATGTARALLTFPQVDRAIGYAVYEASEAALRVAAGEPPIPKSGPGSTIGARAIALKGLATSTAAADAFARINPQLLPSPRVEVKLSGAVDGL